MAHLVSQGINSFKFFMAYKVSGHEYSSCMRIQLSVCVSSESRGEKYVPRVS